MPTRLKPKRVLDETARRARRAPRRSCASSPHCCATGGSKVQRYVRAASPAQGTLLASGNFDLFLSGLLTLIGQVPFFFGSPLYSAFKRVVIEIAKNRTNAHLVPGIEAMLPDSPMARLLRDAPVRSRHRDGRDCRRHPGRQPAEAAGRAAHRLPAVRKRRQRPGGRYAGHAGRHRTQGQLARAVRPRRRRLALPLLRRTTTRASRCATG